MLLKHTSSIDKLNWNLTFRFLFLFTGNQCKALLKNINVLRTILKRDPKISENADIKQMVACMEAFAVVKDCCFGQFLKKEYYVDSIKDFAYYWISLVNRFQSVDALSFNVTLKCHILLAHVVDFLERQNSFHEAHNKDWIWRGLGFWSVSSQQNMNNLSNLKLFSFLIRNKQQRLFIQNSMIFGSHAVLRGHFYTLTMTWTCFVLWSSFAEWDKIEGTNWNILSAEQFLATWAVVRTL